MRRRRLLVAAAAAGGSLLAGCSEGPVRGSDQARTTSSMSPTTVRFDAEDCPSLDGSAVCYQAASEDAPAVLVPSTETASLSGGTIGFTLQNRSDARLSFRPYGWQCWRDGNGDGWTRIDDPTGRRETGETMLSPEGTYSWQVAVGPVTVSADRPPVTINDLEFERRRYTFAVEARGNERHTYTALFLVTE